MPWPVSVTASRTYRPGVTPSCSLACAGADVLVRRGDPQSSAVRHRIARVRREIHQHLIELTGIGLHDVESGVDGDLELDVLANQPRQQRCHGVHDLVEVDGTRLQHLFAAECQELPRQVGGPLARFLDLQHVAPAGMVGVEAVEQQVRVPEDGGEDVVEVVCDAARQPSDRLHLQRLPELHVALPQRVFAHPALRQVTDPCPEQHTIGVVDARDRELDRQAQSIGSNGFDLDPLADDGRRA